MPESHHDAKSAWLWLVEKGGLEPEGRDSELLSMLKDRLDPETGNLEEALASATVTGFLNAFFGVVAPFVDMMRDLLEYFEAADATEGPINWVLVLGEQDEELEVDLDAFRKWIEIAEISSSGSRSVPILTYSGFWELRKGFYPTRTPDPNRRFEEDFRQPEPPIKDRQLTDWLGAYERGAGYLDLPAAVGHALSDPGAVGDVAALVVEIYSAIRAIAPNWGELDRKARLPSDDRDFWSAKGLRNFEHDRWVRGRVLDLAAYEQATADQQLLVSQELSRQFKDLPRRRMRYDITESDLEAILSLPAWKQRYELYSAWILTLLLKAMEGHSIQLHHDNGRLSFPFRKTLMASVLSAVPALEVYSERREPAVNPVGHGRKNNVQPDYSLWKQDETCPLVVESKQYNRSSTSNFAAALNDYAAAMRDAKVILANYGPVSDRVLAAVSEERRSRCVAIGYVHPEETKGRERFCEVVRDVVGKPNPRTNLKSALTAIGNARPELLVVDVSGSMRTSIDSPSGRASLSDLIAQTGVSRVATVDDHLVAEGPSTRSGLVRILSERGDGGTDLGPTVLDLRRTNPTMLVVTDDDGVKTLNGLDVRKIGAFPLGDSAVTVLLVA